jgi:hypothetical protein
MQHTSAWAACPPLCKHLPKLQPPRVAHVCLLHIPLHIHGTPYITTYMYMESYTGHLASYQSLPHTWKVPYLP